MTRISVVIPAYNEANMLEDCVKDVIDYLKKTRIRYEIIIAEDGSTDGTDKIARMLAIKYSAVRHLHSKSKLGKGLALKRAFVASKGNVACFLDADMPVDVKYLGKLLSFSKSYDVVIGSRYIKGAHAERPFIRESVSRVYNLLLRVMLGCKIYDTYCGFKAFSRRFVEKEISNIRETTWAWDSVVLVEAVKKGYRVKEFPVIWNERKAKHSSSIIRLLSDIVIDGKALVKLFAKWRLGLDIQI